MQNFDLKIKIIPHLWNNNFDIESAIFEVFHAQFNAFNRIRFCSNAMSEIGIISSHKYGNGRKRIPFNTHVCATLLPSIMTILFSNNSGFSLNNFFSSSYFRFTFFGSALSVDADAFVDFGVVGKDRSKE